jgi:lysophospholipase L1-like esterase
VACAGAVELTARVVVWRLKTQPRTERSILEYDPDLGWRKAPGETVVLHGEGSPVVFHTNAQGLRGPDAALAKPDSVARVLLLGDSFAEGGAVAEETSVRAVLEQQLNGRRCGRFEVLNGGTSGYSTDQEYLFFERDGAQYAPDVVVLLFFSNDLEGNTSTHKKPWFELDSDDLVLRGSPVPPPPKERRRRGVDAPVRLSPWHGSAALRLLGLRTERSNPPLHDWLAGAGLVEPAADHAPTRDWLQSYGPATDVTERRWRVTRALLGALRDSVSAHGARLVVLYVPAGFEVDDDDWRRTRERWGLDGEGWDVRVVARELAAACRTLDVPFVDPPAALREADRTGRRAYYQDDPHWNEVGHRVAAMDLAPTLTASCPVGTQRASGKPVR